MNQGDFETFGQWLSSRMEAVHLTHAQAAASMGYSEAVLVKRLCSNQSRLLMKDWPTAAKILQMRFDELLIVLEYFHPDWITEYDAFISNCLRYLLWRVQHHQPTALAWPETLLTIALDEMLEPACAGRFDSTEEQRRIDRRKNKAATAHDKRGRPRRLTDLIHYLKTQFGSITPIFLIGSGLYCMNGGVL
ncbi:MAG: hypothetical protein HY349_07855 [Nitrospirae bacterium]|nr:hypothetical protein [Nitrospirota bacterium]